jgi:malonate-semialdehyde dehydrogenase (acetylating)/methylmalonate-semialdehyde dehydrogenase
MSDTIDHWINGARTPSTGDAVTEVTDPATGRLTATVPLASDEDIRAAVDAAATAFPQWAGTSQAKRTKVMFAFRELLNARADALAAIITAEHRKVLSDAAGEVARGQEIVEFACGIPHLLKGAFTTSASTTVDVHSVREPLGPVAVISPFNFPAMVPMWFFPIAIATGNTVILKPSEKVPTAAMWQAELWQEAGLPDGVFNVPHGGKPAVDGLLTHSDVRAVSFVGSTPIAE